MSFYDTVDDGDVWDEKTVVRELRRHGLDLNDLFTDVGNDARLDVNRYDANAIVAWLGY